MKLSAVWDWIINQVRKRKKRIIFGFVFLLVELYLFFGTGVLLGEETHFLTGEGAFDLQLTSENNSVCQEFVPFYRKLKLVSFRMDMTETVHGDGIVTVTIEDENYDRIFEKQLPFYEVVNCAYTDVEVGKELTPGKTYYLVITADSAYETETPYISVCSIDFPMPENRTFSHGEVMDGQQLVSRYRYTDALARNRMHNAIILSVITALGMMFGLPDRKYLRKGAGILILLGAPYVLGTRLELLNYDASCYLPFAMKWNVGIMYAAEIIVLLITHSPAIATILTNIVLTGLYSANYFMNIYRGTSLRMNDLTAIGTAKEVVGDYDLTPNSHLAMAWAILALILVWSLQTVRWKKCEKATKKVWMFRIASYVVTIAIALTGLFYGGHKLLYTDYLNEVGFADKGLRGFDYQLIYAFDGFLVATCIEVNNSRIVPPEGYSKAKVKELLQGAQENTENGMQDKESQDLPHVILIMNESLADLTVFDGVELSQDNLPFLHSMQENTIKGYTNASVYGGGTANSEFEVFTGCTMSFFAVNYYPYQQAVTKPLNSMVSQMKENGYTTIAMHPERAENWNRKNVYRYYGFDQTYWERDFADAEVIHSGVSDLETYYKIIDLYENRAAGEKLFVFDLTMQNHGGYTMDEAPYAVTATNIDEPQVNEFLSLMKISDEAFEELVHYFEKQDEKVVICMFGDHQPWLPDFLMTTNLKDENVTLEESMKKYKTPFVIWANYDIEEAQDLDISMNYLGGLLMRTAGISMSPFFVYLEQLRKQYPVITLNGFVNAEGVYGGWTGENKEFPEYRMLQYSYLFDNNTVEWGF